MLAVIVAGTDVYPALGLTRAEGLGAGAGAAEARGYMVDSLASRTSFAGGPGGKDARIAPLVPSLQVVLPPPPPPPP